MPGRVGRESEGAMTAFSGADLSPNVPIDVFDPRRAVAGTGAGGNAKELILLDL